MSCSRLRQYLDAWLDGELDAATGATLTDHVRACAACSALKRDREELIERVRGAMPRFTARAALAGEVQAALRTAARGRPWYRWRPTQRPTWRHALAMVAGSAALAVVATVWVLRLDGRDDAAWGDALVERHAQSLAETLLEVRATDRHQIKPWFHGKVDFAPTVRDLSAQGFVLEGARLDRLLDKPTAVLVYRIRKHPINLFVWRADTQQGVAPHLSKARGFVLARWNQDGLQYAAVSDVEARDLERFAHAMAAP